MEPKYNKDGERQYNNQKLDAAKPDTEIPDIEEFNEGSSPVSNELSGTVKTKEEQELSMKAIELSLDIIKLTTAYKLDDIFRTSAMVLKYISAK